MTVPLPFETLVALVADRLVLLAYLPSGDPSPIRGGAGPATCARLAGVGCDPCQELTVPPRRGKPIPMTPIDVGEIDPVHVTRAALRKLVLRGELRTTSAGLYRPRDRRG